MLDKLSLQQEKLMDKVRDEWIQRLDNCPSLNKKEATKWINWLYKLCGYDTPKVVFLDSPLGCQIAANQLKNNNRDQVWDQVESQVWDQVGSQVESQVWDQVRSQVRDQVRDQVWDQVESQVRDQVESQVRDQVRDQESEFYSFCAYGEIGDYPWVSFYDYFSRLGLILGDALEKFNNFMFLLKSGIYTMIQFEKTCFVSAMPKKLSRDEQGRLHSIKGAAIEFRDGFKLYYLNGISFEEKLFKKVTRKNVSLKTILSIPDIDQRTVALKVYGIERIIGSDKARLVNESPRGNKLYLLSDVFRSPTYYLGFSCPSTGRFYLEGVREDIGQKEDADNAQAFALGLTKEEYSKLETES